MTQRQITEVWDYRLSSAYPVIYRPAGGKWTVAILPKSAPDFTAGAEPVEPLAVHELTFDVVDGDEWDDEKLDAAFAWLRSVRDDYALEDIEERKPHAAAIRRAEAAAAEANRILAEMAAKKQETSS